MADGVWKGVYPQVLGRSRQLSLNKFLDPSTPSMRKVDDGEKKEKKKEKRKKRMAFLVATTPERQPLERRTLVPKCAFVNMLFKYYTNML